MKIVQTISCVILWILCIISNMIIIPGGNRRGGQRG